MLMIQFLGDVVILGEEKEGAILEARTDSLSDDDGIASIDVCLGTE
ncbi:MAG: hypothetical protein CM15mP98_11740 [Paracoccaceae bacterium]|nr:MAG: hypothetical protein CM15mP98_11740 [Paracoccaceae bacterium]